MASTDEPCAGPVGEGMPRPGLRPESVRLLLLASFLAGLLLAWVLN